MRKIIEFLWSGCWHKWVETGEDRYHVDFKCTKCVSRDYREKE